MFGFDARFEINEAALDFALNSTTGLVGRWLNRRGRLMVRGARRDVGARTGALRQSIDMDHYRIPLGQRLVIGSNLPYAYMHHEGTRPHVIVDTQGAMAFRQGGRRVVTKVVRHPGTRPNKYLTKQLKYVLT